MARTVNHIICSRWCDSVLRRAGSRVGPASTSYKHACAWVATSRKPGSLEGRRGKMRHIPLSEKGYIQLAFLDSKFDSKFFEFMTIVKCENFHEKMLHQQTEQWLVLSSSCSGTSVNSQLLRNSSYHSESPAMAVSFLCSICQSDNNYNYHTPQRPFNCSHCFQIDLRNFFLYPALWFISQRAAQVSLHPFRYHLTFFLNFEFDCKKLTGT